MCVGGIVVVFEGWPCLLLVVKWWECGIKIDVVRCQKRECYSSSGKEIRVILFYTPLTMHMKFSCNPIRKRHV